MATIPYANVIKTEPLPIDAQNIATRIRLMIAGTRSGKQPDILDVLADDTGGSSGAYSHVTYVPAPIVHDYQDAAHATYGVVRSEDAPQGLAPFLAPTDASIPEPTAYGMSNPGSPSAVRDGDGTTYAQNDGTHDTIDLRFDTGVGPSVQFVGFKIKYAANTQASTLPATGFKGHVAVAMTIRRDTALAWPIYTVKGYWGLPDTDANEFYVLFPFDARGLAENQGSPGSNDTLQMTLDLYSLPGSLAAAGDLKVYEFYPLVLDAAKLDGIAAQYVKLPAATPTRVTVRGYVPPAASHTITGWPGGDYTGKPAKHTYGGGLTIIDFEQKGAPIGSTQEAAQVQAAQTANAQSLVTAQGYPLRLGERQ